MTHRALPASLARRTRAVTAKAALEVASGLKPFPGLFMQANSADMRAQQAAMIERLKAAHILASAAHAQKLCAGMEAETGTDVGAGTGASADSVAVQVGAFSAATLETCAENITALHVIENATRRAALDARMTRFEIDRVARAVTQARSVLDEEQAGGLASTRPSTGSRIVLIKGGAYVALDSEAGAGRRLSDLDILVSEEGLASIETGLLSAGWAFDEKTHNPYDQAYYRAQMHELPPMRHKSRRTLLDVHFRLMPRRARYQLDHETMMQSANQLSSRPLMVLAGDDAVIYAAAHAFLDGSFETPLRSLLELHTLTKDHTQLDIQRLYARTREVGGAVAVSIMATLLAAYFGAHTPFSVSLDTGVVPKANKGLVAIFKMRAALKRRYLWPAKLVLWVRGHWLRAPFANMVKHLAVKVLRRVGSYKGKDH